MGNRTTTIVAAVVALVVVLAATVIGLSLTSDQASSTPMVTAVIGIIAPTVVSLLALLKVEGVSDKLDDDHVRTNVKSAMQERADEYARGDVEDARHDDQEHLDEDAAAEDPEPLRPPPDQ
jgi:SMODS and SLOG-associating 2TM effector domain